jgi:hypothetical protein
MSDQQENIFGEPIEPAEEPAAEETNPLHEQFLSSLPEDVDRDMAAQLVPHWDKFVQDQFTERDSQLKQFEPYQALIEAGVSPEEAQWYLENREQIHQEPQQQEFQPQEIDEFGDPVLTGLQQQVAQQNEVLMALLQEREQQQQFEQQMMQEQAFEQSQSEIKDELRSLKDQYPELTEDDADAICSLASKYAEPGEDGKFLDTKEVLSRGFADFQRIASHAERALFEKKTSQPAPAERGGQADTSAEPVTSFEQANQHALARIRASLGA